MMRDQGQPATPRAGGDGEELGVVKAHWAYSIDSVE